MLSTTLLTAALLAATPPQFAPVRTMAFVSGAGKQVERSTPLETGLPWQRHELRARLGSDGRVRLDCEELQGVRDQAALRLQAKVRPGGQP